ncbi:hypothetical protein M1N08_01445 [Dehalococcoidia bacterium]|nr:hypothetical protein [Dehalococcoidia bacterium]
MGVSDSEVDAEVERIVENAGESGESVREILNSQEARESLHDQLLSPKAIDFLVRTATGEDAGLAESEESQ